MTPCSPPSCSAATVVYADEELKEIRLSGDMKRYGEVEEFLHFLEISTGTRFSVKNKTIVVSIK